MSVTVIFHPCFFINAQTFLVCREESFDTEAEAMDWAEIHAPVITGDTPDIDTCGGYLQVSTYDDGRIHEANAMSRFEYDYWKSEAENHYDPDAAYERHLENAGWMDQAFQEQMEARFGCLDYWQSKALASGRVPE